MKNIVPIDALERQINFADPLDTDLTIVNGTKGEQGAPEITALPNGNFVVVFRNPFEGNFGDLDIMWQEFKADGTRLAGPHRLEFDVNSQLLGEVAPRANNGFAAVWSDNTFASIEIALVDPGATDSPTEFRLADNASTFTDPTLATLSNGTFFVAYEEHVGLDTQIRFSIVNTTGTANIVDNALLEDGTGRGAGQPSVTASGDKAIVAFSDANSSFPEDIRLKMFGPTGALLDTKDVEATSKQLLHPDTATLKDGRVVIVWEELTGSGGDPINLHGRIYNPATKSFSTGVFDVDAGAGRQEDPSVAALPDGGFIVSWTDNSQSIDADNSGTAIHARRFDSADAPAGDEFLVNTSAGADQHKSALAVSSFGQVFAVWTSPDSNDGDATGVQGRRMDTKVETVNGTPGNDAITTFNLSEPINGLAGADTIDARGGNDVVNGGDGNDLIATGSGADAVVFDLKPKKLTNVDHITDFLPGADEIRLDISIFKKLKLGELKEKAFFAHRHADEAKDDKDKIVYDTKSGELRYDKDGAGGHHAKLFAILDGAPNLDNTDVVVVASKAPSLPLLAQT